MAFFLISGAWYSQPKNCYTRPKRLQSKPTLIIIQSLIVSQQDSISSSLLKISQKNQQTLAQNKSVMQPAFKSMPKMGKKCV